MAQKQGALVSYAGIGVVVLGISLGASLVQLNGGGNTRVLVAAGAASAAGQACGQYQFPDGKNDKRLTPEQWQTCMRGQCKAGQPLPKCPNTTDSLCRQHCISVATSQGGSIDCCQLAPNQGCTKVDGKCGGQLPEDKPKEEGMGGMPPMLPMIPMPMPKPDMPMPPQDCDTKTGSSSPRVTAANQVPCPPKGVGGLLGNIFGGESSVGDSVKSSLESAASKLKSFLSGDTDEKTTTAGTEAKNPTVTVTSHTSSVTASPSADTTTAAGASGSAAPTNPVTGFGAGGSGGSNQSALTQIGQTLSAIGVTLKNMISSLLN
jgi:hypothetical protein